MGPRLGGDHSSQIILFTEHSLSFLSGRFWPEAVDTHCYWNFAKAEPVFWIGDGTRYLSNQSQYETEYPILLHETCRFGRKVL